MIQNKNFVDREFRLKQQNCLIQIQVNLFYIKQVDIITLIEMQAEPQTENTEPTDNNTLNNDGQQTLNEQQARTQLKQKIKQNKVLQVKNKKLQSKFIELFKEQKALKKDWTALTTIIKQIFPDLEAKQQGKYDIDQLRQHWNLRQSTFTKKIQQMMEELAKTKEKMEREVSELTQERISQISRQSKEKVDNINKQLEGFKKNNRNLAEQLAEFDKKLDAKNDEVSKLTKQKLKLEHQINQMKMKSITDELTDQKSIEQEKNNIQRNQFLALRQQVDDLMIKRDELRIQLKNAKSIIQKLKSALSDKNKQIQKIKDEQTIQQKTKQQQRQIKLQSKISVSSSQDASQKKDNQKQDENNIHHLIGDDEYIHREYMKNVFIRYMKSWTNGDATQTEILLNIILTILKFTSKQKDIIKEKKKGWFGII